MDTRILLCVVLAALCHATHGGKEVAPRIKMADGREIPQIGLGTFLGFPLKPTDNPDDVVKAAEWAIEDGYRLIDTAAIYNTERQVGQAIANKIQDGTITRDDIFVTTKLWMDNNIRERVVPALKESLEKLNLSYVDLYLIHWPMTQGANNTFVDYDYVETWKGMAEARRLGLARSIGVCNFNIHQLKRLRENSDEKIAALQIELNLHIQEEELLADAKAHGVAVMAYTPFGSLFPSKAAKNAPPPRIDDPELVAIATKYNKTVPQIALRYLIELGVVPIPKSVSKARIDQNLDIFDFQLTAEEKATLKSMDKGFRTISLDFWKEAPNFPFEK